MKNKRGFVFNDDIRNPLRHPLRFLHAYSLDETGIVMPDTPFKPEPIASLESDTGYCFDGFTWLALKPERICIDTIQDVDTRDAIASYIMTCYPYGWVHESQSVVMKWMQMEISHEEATQQLCPILERPFFKNKLADEKKQVIAEIAAEANQTLDGWYFLYKNNRAITEG